MPQLAFKRLDIPELEVVWGTGVRGDFMDITIGRDTPKAEMPSCIVYAEGAATVTRQEGDADHPVVQVEAGQFSLDNSLYDTIKAGKLQLVVDSSNFTMYCLATPKGTPIRARSIRLGPGEAQVVDVGNLVFVAMGTVQTDTEAGTHQLTAPALIDVRSRTAFIESAAGALCIQVARA